MFDTGPISLASVPLPTEPPSTVDIFSGDAVAGDGIYTRTSYISTPTSLSLGACLEQNDRNNLGHTFSKYTTLLPIDPSSTAEFSMHVSAIDTAGSIDTTEDVLFPIQGTSVILTLVSETACGPPTGAGGCLGAGAN
jgi:hypothetical protein